MTSATPDWLDIKRGDAPLLVSLPHTGIHLPPDVLDQVISPWLARKDTDWWIDRLYAFAGDIGATIVRTSISRTVIDVNRDPFGRSLYPGQTTTGLCPTTTFDGEPLYQDESGIRPEEIASRRKRYYDPYHELLAAEVIRLRRLHDRIVVYDCHSIRSIIPRLFDGELPNFNVGTNQGTSCDPALTARVEAALSTADGTFSRVVDGRFTGGFITRSLGVPADGIHAIQMELACRGYMRERLGPVDENVWPSPYDESYAAPLRLILERVFDAALAFAYSG